MQNLNITLVQYPLYWEDIEKNENQFLNEIRYPEKTDLIVLPEMFSTGFSMKTDLAEKAGKSASHILKTLSEKTGAAVCGSSMFKENGLFYNRFIFQKPGEKAELYNKRHLFSLAGEEQYYSPGQANILIEWKGWKILPQVCYDLRFPVWSRRSPKQNYDLLLYTANWPDRRGNAWRSLLKARAIENQSYVAGCNRCGNDGNGISHAGDSQIIDPSGKSLQKARPFQSQLIQAELNLQKMRDFRKSLPFFNDGDTFEISK